MIIPDEIFILILVGIVAFIVYKLISKWLPFNLLRHRVKPLEDLPRDAMDRCRRDMKKSAKMSKPPQLKFLWLSGDEETPPRYLGRIWGLQRGLGYNIVYYRPKSGVGIRTLIAEMEFSTDSHFEDFFIFGRAITIHGILFYFPEPIRGWEKLLSFKDGELGSAAPLQALWIRRMGFIQILVEKQQMLDRIEIKAWLEMKAVLPKMKIRSLMERGAELPDGLDIGDI